MNTISSFIRHILLLLVLLTVQGLSYKSRKASSYEGSPEIRSVGKLYRIQVGEILTLPCDVRNLGPMVLMWKKGQRVLTAGTLIVKRDKRISLLEHHLVLSNLNIHDGGEYSCEIETDEPEPLAVTHTVEILVPPSVMPQPRSGRIVVRKGTSVTLECRANGNPTPSVAWTRKGLPFKRKDSEKSNNGMLLNLRNVDRNDSGGYKCRASNGVGNSASQFIHLLVLYEPDIRVPRKVVHGGVNRTAILSCRVHAEPDPDVKWYKNSIQLDSVGRYRLQTDGKKEYSLIIRNIGIEDYSTYACAAVNSLGRDREVIRLTGTPAKPEIENIFRLSDGRWKMSWMTESFSSVTQYRVLFRSIPKSKIDVETSFAWKNVVLKVDKDSSPSESRVYYSYHFDRLAPKSTYEVQIQAKNSFGWSDRSRVQSFYTQVDPLKEPPNTQMGHSSATPKKWLDETSSPTTVIYANPASAHGSHPEEGQRGGDGLLRKNIYNKTSGSTLSFQPSTRLLLCTVYFVLGVNVWP